MQRHGPPKDLLSICQKLQNHLTTATATATAITLTKKDECRHDMRPSVQLPSVSNVDSDQAPGAQAPSVH